MKDGLYTLFFAGLLGFVCALLMAGAGRFTAPYKEANERAEEVANILKVLGVPVEPKASSKELLRLFEEKVKVENRSGLTIYVYYEDGKAGAVAVPFSGQGLWGPIKGFLSLEPDWKTIRGISFPVQEETPGLGGEIGADWFKKQFEGKTIESADGKFGMKIRQNAGKESNGVDAITGATMTSEKVERMLNAVIEQIAKERSQDVH